MIKVRTFTSQLKIFHMMQEISDLDAQVNGFIASNQIRRVISASDALTTGGDGETVGIIRILTYEEP
jgi:hypothetical protein